MTLDVKLRKRDIIKMKYNVIDLFCGSGGFSKGFQDAGYNVRLGIDAWEDAVVTYQHNFPDAEVINKDITTINTNEILKILNIQKDDIDVIIGGPPCQGFSLSGKRMIDDPRNILYKSFVDFVGEFKPKVFIMENVPGLIKLFGGSIKDSVIEDFSSLGYEVKYQTLSSEEYGVPQKRRRVFFVGINQEKLKNTRTFIFPAPTHGDGLWLEEPLTCEQAISDLDFIPDDVALNECEDYKVNPQTPYQKKMRAKSNYLFNHVATIHKDKTKEIIALVPDGGNYKSLPDALKGTRKVNIAWTRMNSQKPCFTIDTGHNHHFHYKENRVPTVRESARIQSFPDDFRFLGTKTSQLKQVGNAVPPLVAQSLAEEVKKILNRG
ncbi:DNA cytosine methyltransferase [uncultured Trichococcus sp.]|jgi:DNA (cytosine-5)-methyltransferase 1|uniref:DNA cytosine methyltransferase n=1 Tax=uncultured Trichococcus sp. TaxID=189665 RepID=UPI0029C80E24|nr:DNA cytosine methyltransferase [uncultured Trichococcus sp.]